MKVLRTIWEWVRYFMEIDWTGTDRDIKWQRLRADAELDAKRCLARRDKKFGYIQ